MPEPAAMLTIGQVALRSGVAPSALRFYEAEGLIASERSEGNQRRYQRAVLRRVAVIQAGRAAGIPLASIGAALWRCCPPTARRPSATGRASRAPGAATSRSASRCSSACATTSRPASAAAASRCAPAGSSTRSTAPRSRAPGARYLLGDEPAARGRRPQPPLTYSPDEARSA